MQGKIHLSEWLIMFESYVKINWNTWNQVFKFCNTTWNSMISCCHFQQLSNTTIGYPQTCNNGSLYLIPSAINNPKKKRKSWKHLMINNILCVTLFRKRNFCFAHSSDCYLFNFLRSRCLFVVAYLLASCSSISSKTFNVLFPFIYIN